MAGRPQDRPRSASELGASLTGLGQSLEQETVERQLPGACSGAAPPFSASRVLAVLCGAMGVLLAAFTAWGFSLHGSTASSSPPTPTARTTAQTGPATTPAQASDIYAPKGLVVTPGQDRGQLIVTWQMPVRPEVVATVLYEGSGPTRARAIVTYGNGRKSVPGATLGGLPQRRVCVSAVHIITVGDMVTSAASRPACAVPR